MRALPGDVAFVESGHFLQHQLREPRNVLGIDGQTGEVCYGFCRLRNTPADDIGYYFGNCRPIAESEGIRLGQRIAHGLVLTHGAFVCPHIHVAKQFNSIQLVDPDEAFYVCLLRDIKE